MSKMQGLEAALKKASGKPGPQPAQPKAIAPAEPEPAPQAKAKPSSRKKKEYTGAWLNPDFGMSLRMVQLRKRKDAEGRKVYLDDLMAEALNDLFIKYDVPTVHHD